MLVCRWKLDDMFSRKLTINYAINGPSFESVVVSDDVLPGMLLQRSYLSQEEPFVSTVQAHNIENGIALPLVAIESPYNERDIDSWLIMGNTICYHYCLPGDVFIGIADEGVPTITPGMLLSSAGNGKLHPIPEGRLKDRTVVGYALAAPGTTEAYKYFAINGVSLEEVYARSESEYYLTEPMKTVLLDDRFPVEVI